MDICFFCRHNQVNLSSFSTFHQSVNKCDWTDADEGEGTGFYSGAPEFMSCYYVVRGTQSLIFCEVFCASLFAFLSFFFGHYNVCHLGLLITHLLSSRFS